ncbi:hypothetical protein KIPB_016537, partial [Kipferlia bialata]
TGAATASSVVSSSLTAKATEDLVLASDSGTVTLGSGGSVVTSGSFSAAALDSTPIGNTVPSSGVFSSLTLDGGYSFPVVDGTDGQVLLTDGAGHAKWGVPPAIASVENLVVDDDLSVTGNLILESNVVSASDLSVNIGAETYTFGESLLSVPVPMSVTGTATASSVVSSSLTAKAAEDLVLT